MENIILSLWEKHLCCVRSANKCSLLGIGEYGSIDCRKSLKQTTEMRQCKCVSKYITMTQPLESQSSYIYTTLSTLESQCGEFGVNKSGRYLWSQHKDAHWNRICEIKSEVIEFSRGSSSLAPKNVIYYFHTEVRKEYCKLCVNTSKLSLFVRGAMTNELGIC